MADWQPHFNLPATVVTLAVIAYLVGVLPWRGRRKYRALETTRLTDPGALTRRYRRSMLTWWPLTAAVGFLPQLDPGLGYADLGLRLPVGEQAPPSYLLCVLVVPLALVVGAVRLMLWSRLKTLPAALRAAAAVLPVTYRERWLAAGVAVTAGVCEEVVFRGLLITAGVSILRLPLWASVGFAAAVFGLGHLYQGRRGMIATGVAGVLFSLPYLASGSLLLPIVLHVMVDLVAFLFVPTDLVTRTLRELPSARTGQVAATP